MMDANMQEPTMPTDIVIDTVLMNGVMAASGQDSKRATVEAALRGFIVEPMVGADIAAKAAADHRVLRGPGIAVRKAIAMPIGTYRIETGHRLLHKDRDFDPLERRFGLLGGAARVRQRGSGAGCQDRTAR